MIIYQASKSQFLLHALRDDIEDVMSRHYRSATGHGVGPPEIQAWKHSLLEMAKVLSDEEIPDEAAVAIEYQLPQTSKRIDFVITGEDAAARTKVIIIELKQWSESRRSEKDAIVWARRGGRTAEREGTHPSYQAWSYAAYLQDFNAAVQDGAMTLQPCAYLHNHPRNGEIDHPHYREHLERAPDAPLAAYLRSRLVAATATAAAEDAEAAVPATASLPSNVVPLRRVSKEERDAGAVAVPVIDLRFAAGTFSDAQAMEDGADDWVALPEWVRPHPGLFVAQVVGESMNRRIPNGSWCLFRANPSGTREGKVVVVQHRSIANSETGGRYTVKLYASEKVPVEDGGWRHERITLQPDSDRSGFEPIALSFLEGEEGFSVIAELLMVLPENP